MGFSVGVRKRKKKPYYFKTEKEVRVARRKLLSEKEKGTLATGPQQTLKIKWLEQVCKVTIKPTTYEQYRSTVRHHLIPALGHVKLQKLTTERIQEFCALYGKELVRSHSEAFYASNNVEVCEFN